MKAYYLFIFVFLLSSNVFRAQVCKTAEHHHQVLDEKKALENFGYVSFLNDFSTYVKSKGYDLESDECLRNFYYTYQSSLAREIFNLYIEESTKASHYELLYQRQLKEFKEQLSVFISHEKQLRYGFEKIQQSQATASNHRDGSNNPTPQAGCTNMNFEAGNLGGWTTNSQSGIWGGTNSAYVTTPGTDPLVPAINRVFNGSFSACIDVIGSGTDLDWREISQTFLVTPANKDFVFYVAVVMDGGAHTCATNPFFNVSVKDASNNTVPCSAISLIGSNPGGAACSAFTGWNTAGWYDYLNWTPVIVPLGNYVGQNVTIKFRVTRCNGGGGHGARAYLEADCNPAALTATGNLICPGKTVRVNAPNTPGYTYNWSGPSGFSASTYSISPALSGVYSVTMALASNPSCKMVLDTILTSVPSPTANFNYTVTPCLATFSVPVVDASTQAAGDPISSYTWIWGDATANGSGASSTHTYASTGTKTVELKIQSTAGCRDSINYSFNIQALPSAIFALSNACLGTSATFTSTSLAPNPAVITSQAWSFGDGTNGSGSNTSHTYLSPGTYPVKLVVSNNQTCKDSVTHNVVIYPKPVVNFTTSTVCFNSVTNFTNSSTIAAPDNIAGWTWDFDNNGSIDNTTQSPNNTYASPGTYTVKLIATSNNGCKDSTTVNAIVNALPTASFTPVNACLNANINLNNSSTIPLPDNISVYSWNFGANANPLTSATQNPPMLSYNSSGVKTITLNITANTSCTASITQTVMVYPQPVANFNVTSVCQSSSTEFIDASTTAGGSITNWDWDFENDQIIDNTSSNPNHVYASSGTYTASLIVTDNNSCRDTIALPVNVWGHSIPDFTPGAVCYGTVTTFTNLTNTTTNANVGGTPSYTWDFADGSTISTSTNPAHTFTIGANANAIYNVTLTATSTHSCIDQAIKLVSVYALPTASFTADSVCQGSTSHLLDASNGNGNALSNYEWDFLSNGTVDASNNTNPSFIFPNYGNNAVTYTISTNPLPGLTCKNVTNTISVWVNPNPMPDFVFVNKCINAQPNTFDASSSSIAIGTNSIYAWSYGDGNNGSGITSNHSFVTAATYNTTLTVTSNKGCQTSVVKQVEVYKKPIIAISNSNACDRKAMTFTATPQTGSGNVVSWDWDFNNNLNSVEAMGPNVSYVFPSAGQQTVSLITITNNGCRDTITVNKYIDYVPNPLFTVDKPSGCPEHCVTFTDATLPITGPAQNVDWKWVFGDGTEVHASSGANQQHCYENSSSNQLAQFDVKLVVTTDKGCTDSLNKSAFITVYPTPIAQYVVDPNPGSILTPMVYFQNESQDYTKWIWKFGDGTAKDSVNINPTHIYESENAGSYYSSIFVYNQYGCWDSTYLRIDINPEFTFYIPNAFSPQNGDGINDIFTGYGIGIDKFEMWIFDRWGEKIFHTEDITKGWDGTAKGSDEKVKPDVYVWKVKVKDVLGVWHSYVGHVTVLK